MNKIHLLSYWYLIWALLAGLLWALWAGLRLGGPTTL